MLEQAAVKSAIVISVDKFYETSEILVQERETKTAVYAEIMTPIGGLPNMAMQWVPPVGAVGYILFQGGDSRRPVWIGSKLIPWDAAGADNIADADVRNGLVEADDGAHDFIIKTQNTTFENQDVDDVENNKVENILKMSKGEFTLAKVQQTDKYEYKTENYDIKEEPHYQIITMQDDKIAIKFNSSQNDGEYAHLTLTEGQTSIETSYGDKVSSIKISQNGVAIDTDGQSVITIGPDGTINITGKKMIVDADKIELGGNSNKAVLFEPLRDFINQTYMKHTHASPAGPTAPPAPSVNKMASKKVKLE